MSNRALWDRVCMTDPKAVKPITGKQYNGNSPKSYWIVERLTDEFGPCGIGWGFQILGERIERFSDTDSLHIAVVRLWYEMDGKRGELEQIGQTKASYQSNAGKFILDEDAPKKSVTDALVKCASYLGFAGDIFSGRWDDSKYVQHAAAEWEKRKGDQARDKWLSDWMAHLSEATSSKDLKERTANAVADAKKYEDGDAEGQFLAYEATRIAQAKKKQEPANASPSA